MADPSPETSLSSRILARLASRAGATGAAILAELAQEDRSSGRTAAGHAEVAAAIRGLVRERKIGCAQPGRTLSGARSFAELLTLPLTMKPADIEREQGGKERLIGDGRYRLLSVIGSGAMSTVHLAEQTSLRRKVAVKVFSPTRLSGVATLEELQARFEREAHAIAQLSHPHVVQVYDYGREGDELWYAMEYVPFGTLGDRVIQEKGPLPPATVAQVMLSVAEGLEAAHARGIIHRDVKPQNVLMGTIKIADFGFAKALSGGESSAQLRHLTAASIVLGTPQFVAPEVADFKPADHRSDIYSLGATAYFAATGRLLFDVPKDAGHLEWFHRHGREHPRVIRELVPTFPSDLATIIHRCLAKEPAARHQTYKSLIRDLKQVLAKMPAPGTQATKLAETGERTPGPVSEMLSELEALLWHLERGYEEQYGSRCFSARADFMAALWDLAKARKVPAALAAILGGPPEGLPDLGKVAWEGIRLAREAKEHGLIADTGPVETVLSFLQEVLGDPALAAFRIEPQPEDPVMKAEDLISLEGRILEEAAPARMDNAPEATTPEASGTLVEGDPIGPYRIQGLIGEGAMAKVYRALDSSLDRVVALKVYAPKARSLGTDGEARFEREAKIAASVDHPNVVRIHAAGHDESRAIRWLAMEYVPGRTLEAHLAERGSLSAEEALPIARQALEGLRAMHQVGLVHRDIKPSNILLVEREGTAGPLVKIADFGLAFSPRQRDGHLTQANTIMGTPLWASPEQAAGTLEVDARTDIYSLGMVLYNLLAGRMAYPPAPNALAQFAMLQKSDVQPTPLRTVVESVSEEVAALVHRMIAKKYEERIATAAEAIQEIDRFLDRGAPKETGPTTRMRSWALPAALAAGLIVGLALWANRQTGSPPSLHAGGQPLATPSAAASSSPAGSPVSPSPAGWEPPAGTLPPSALEFAHADLEGDLPPLRRKVLADRLKLATPSKDDTQAAYFLAKVPTDVELAWIRGLWQQLDQNEPLVARRDHPKLIDLVEGYRARAAGTDFTSLLGKALQADLELAKARHARFFGDLKVGRDVSLVLAAGKRLSGTIEDVRSEAILLRQAGNPEAIEIPFAAITPETWAGEEGSSEALRVLALHGDVLHVATEFLLRTDLKDGDPASPDLLAHLPGAIFMMAVRALSDLRIGTTGTCDALLEPMEEAVPKLPPCFAYLAETQKAVEHELSAQRALAHQGPEIVLEKFPGTRARLNAIREVREEFERKTKIEGMAGGFEPWEIEPLEKELRERQKHLYWDPELKVWVLNDTRGARELSRELEGALEGYSVEFQFLAAPAAEKAVARWAMLLTDKLSKETWLQLEGNETDLFAFEVTRGGPAEGKRVGKFQAKGEWLKISVIPIGSRLLVYSGEELAFDLALPKSAALCPFVRLAFSNGLLRLKSVKVPGVPDEDE